MSTKQCIVICSGGLDSATVLAKAVLERGKENVVALYFKFKGVPKQELRALRRFTKFYDVALQIVPLNFNMQATYDGYVPARNLVFQSIAVAYAERYSVPEILTGYNMCEPNVSTEQRIDTTPEFVAAFNRTVKAGGAGHVFQNIKVKAPFAKWYKEDIVRYGLVNEVPYKYTFSCIRAKGRKACGYCLNCRDRQIAFAANGVKDPIAYV